ncbi:hypothetical protein V6N12_012656 [Hibiscus sabdariffa]|uniref:Uncharacterized protein n=1 Tax=Hibiscus sabdariffa TaxID=183260 RepID=A0ABR2DG44_9ROSI
MGFGPNGRPLDGWPEVTLPPVLERGGLSVDKDDLREHKKGKNGGSVVVNRSGDGQLSVTMVGSGSGNDVMIAPDDGNLRASVEGVGGMDAMESDSGKVSYASMAAKNSVEMCKGLSMDEIFVLEEDYIIDMNGLFPSIKFSDCVHNQIYRNMSNTEQCKTLARALNGNSSDGVLPNTVEEPSLPSEPSDENLYGPWMIVDTRRRRTTNRNMSVRTTSNSSKHSDGLQGSRYAALVDEQGPNLVHKGVVLAAASNMGGGKVGIVETTKGKFRGASGSNGSVSGGAVSGPTPGLVYTGGMEVVPTVNGNEVEVTWVVDKGSDKHVATTIVETPAYMGGLVGGKIVHARSTAGCTTNEGHRRGISIKKAASIKPPVQPPLFECINKFSEELNSTVDRRVSGGDVGTSDPANGDNLRGLDFEENLATQSKDTSDSVGQNGSHQEMEQ